MPTAVPVGSALTANVRARSKMLLAKMEKTDRLHKVVIASQDAADLVYDSITDSLQDKLCGEDLNYPNYIGIHSKQLDIMSAKALEGGEEINHVLQFLVSSETLSLTQHDE